MGPTISPPDSGPSAAVCRLKVIGQHRLLLNAHRLQRHLLGQLDVHERGGSKIDRWLKDCVEGAVHADLLFAVHVHHDNAEAAHLLFEVRLEVGGDADQKERDQNQGEHEHDQAELRGGHAVGESVGQHFVRMLRLIGRITGQLIEQSAGAVATGGIHF